MTRSRKTSWLMVAFVLLIGLYPTAALAQHDPAEPWEGAIDAPGMKIEVSVELAHSDGAWSGSIDVPVQNLHDLALNNIAVDGAAVSSTITGVPGVPTFDGTLADDGLTFSGHFTQADQRLRFSLTRASEAERLAAEQTLRAALGSLRVFIDAALVEWEVPGSTSRPMSKETSSRWPSRWNRRSRPSCFRASPRRHSPTHKMPGSPIHVFG